MVFILGFLTRMRDYDPKCYVAGMRNLFIRVLFWYLEFELASITHPVLKDIFLR